MTTVLGSCVSATFFHRPSGLAAICHAMQPRCPRSLPSSATCPAECENRYRYTVCAIEGMHRRLLQFGVQPHELEVKLFGGAALIGKNPGRADSRSIGQLNVKAATDSLIDCGLTLKVANVGGNFGRKMIFDTATGEVFMKRLKKIHTVEGASTLADTTPVILKRDF
ncbi:MAG: chemotaxis protein CheD [Desulfatitalea sp.]|nr:chemotaxis protein CheD [Desulfatitalea sp.]NNK02567.1 chemotaxis protein CheD [Desulfatitalea sp.]